MKIIHAQDIHLSEILIINKIYNYGNPDDFIFQHIQLGQVLVAMKDKKVVGFLLYQYIWWNTLFLALVKVLPEYQNIWIGTSLIQKFEMDAKNKWNMNYISSTELTNANSQKFHEKLWFQQIGLLDMPHWEEIFYTKDL